MYAYLFNNCQQKSFTISLGTPIDQIMERYSRQQTSHDDDDDDDAVVADWPDKIIYNNCTKLNYQLQASRDTQ